MSWLSELFFGQGVAHSVLMFAIVIALGIVLGKVKVWGVSLGITWILFVGIICSHFGMRVDGHTLHFMKEFGLILFVYSVGLQVGPGFFSSFRKGGLTLNMLATGIVLLGVVTTYVIHVVTGLPITTMVGILSGAVTNTPGLGAAQQAYSDMTGVNDPTIALRVCGGLSVGGDRNYRVDLVDAGDLSGEVREGERRFGKAGRGSGQRCSTVFRASNESGFVW